MDRTLADFVPPVDWDYAGGEHVHTGRCPDCRAVHIRCRACDTLLTVADEQFGTDLVCRCPGRRIRFVPGRDGCSDKVEVVDRAEACVA